MWRKKQQPRMLRPLASAPVDDGAVHVVLALPMPATALDAFKAAFNAVDVRVRDLGEAGPPPAAVVIPPLSPQLTAMLRNQYPKARFVIMEASDPTWGLATSGPVSRALESADDYLVAGSAHQAALQIVGVLQAQGALIEGTTIGALQPPRPARPTDEPAGRQNR